MFYQHMYQDGEYIFRTHVSDTWDSQKIVSRLSTKTNESMKDSANHVNVVMQDVWGGSTSATKFHTARQEISRHHSRKSSSPFVQLGGDIVG